MNLDHFLDRTWSKAYTCNEFACEVWEYITGESLTERLTHFLNGNGHFIPLKDPKSPCIVLFTRKNADAHVGIFYEGKLLHLNHKGAHYVDLDMVQGFQLPRFYQ